MTDQEPEWRDPGDRERLRDKEPEWFKKLAEQRQREEEGPVGTDG